MSADPGGQLSQQHILELLMDAGMILGILALCWVALAAFGYAAPPPFFFDGLSAERIVENRMLLSVLAFVSIVEYPAMLLVLKAQKQKAATAGGVSASSPLTLRFAMASAVWMYLLVAYFVMR